MPKSVEALFGPSVDNAGIEVYVHPPGTTFEMWGDKHIKILPGQYVRIHVVPFGTIRLGKPYGNCVQSYQRDPHPRGI